MGGKYAVAYAIMAVAALWGGPARSEDDGRRKDEEKCRGGDVMACRVVALDYAEGVTGTGDQEKAREFFALACDGGDAESCALLAFMLTRGVGGPEDDARARELFKKGCCPEQPLACTRYALMLLGGIGGEKDPAQAVAVLDQACNKDMASACSALGGLWTSGEGVPKANRSKARSYYESACHGGKGYAADCVRAGTMWYKGEGGGENRSKAESFYEIGCANGARLGCALLAGLLLAPGRSEEDRERGAKALAKAGTMAAEEGTNLLCRLWDRGDAEPDERAAARKCYAAACASGAAYDCKRLASMAFDGLGGEVDEAEGLKAMERACDGSETEACEVVTSLYYHGRRGAAKDRVKAAQAAVRACKGGNGKLCETMGAKYVQGYAEEQLAPDRKNGKALLEAGCVAGAGGACRMLGLMAYSGDAAAKDVKLARQHFEEACRLNDPDGCVFLATAAAKGEGGDKSLEAARKFFGVACELGAPAGCAEAGRMELDGYGGVQDLREARRHFQGACQGKHGPSCLRIGLMLYRGEGGEQNVAKALDHLEVGCHLEQPEACFQMGAAYYSGGAPGRDFAKAKQAFGRACDLGHTVGCSFAGWLHFSEAEDKEALERLQKGCSGDDEAANGVACANVGLLRLLVEKRPDLALPAFRRACDLGRHTGCLGAAVLLHGDHADEAKALALKSVEPLRTACRDDGDGEACLALLDWFTAINAVEEKDPMREQGIRFLDKDCLAGKKGACRILRLRGMKPQP
jgi:TPR repeat protein